MKEYEKVSLNKIDFIYCAAKSTSYPSIDYMLKQVIIIILKNNFNYF